MCRGCAGGGDIYLERARVDADAAGQGATACEGRSHPALSFLLPSPRLPLRGPVAIPQLDLLRRRGAGPLCARRAAAHLRRRGRARPRLVLRRGVGGFVSGLSPHTVVEGGADAGLQRGGDVPTTTFARTEVATAARRRARPLREVVEVGLGARRAAVLRGRRPTRGAREREEQQATGILLSNAGTLRCNSFITSTSHE